MRRSHLLPIVSAALLIAAAGSRSDGQSDGASSPPTRNALRRAAAPAQLRAAAQTPEQAPVSAAEGTSGPHRRSWKDLARSKSDGKTDKPSVNLSPWSAAGALAVVVGLILVVARLFRRQAPLFSQSLPQEALEILGRRFVEPRQTILLVRIGARILVVGSSANGLNSLGQIDDPVEVDLLAGLCRRGSNAGILGTSFFKLLNGETKKRPAPFPAPASSSAPRSAARTSPLNSQSASQPLDGPPEDFTLPEYDLMRRLRGTASPLPAERTEGAE